MVSLDRGRARRFLSRLHDEPFIAICFGKDAATVYISGDEMLARECLRKIRVTLDHIEEQLDADSNTEEGR